MKIAVMGAGGIGSYLGAMLARSGVDVTLLCRGKLLITDIADPEIGGCRDAD